MRGGVCRVVALLVIGAAAAAAAPAGAADCVPTPVSAVVRHAHVHHHGHRAHRHRAHGHRRLASAKTQPAGGFTPVPLQDRPLPVKAALTGNACTVRHHSGSGEVASVTPQPGLINLATQSLFDVMAALDQAPNSFDADLIGVNPTHADYAGGGDGLAASTPSSSEPDLIGSGPFGSPPAAPASAPYRPALVSNPPTGGSTPPTSGGPTPPTVVVPPTTPPITAGVPEPETWALMILGLGFVGLAARRRTAARALGEAQGEALGEALGEG